MTEILWNVGSISNEITNLVDMLPVSMSGTNMNNVIYGAINYVEQYANVSIGSTSISLKYHNAIIYKTMFDILCAKDIQFVDVGDFVLGDLRISTGTSSKLMQARVSVKMMLDTELRVLGRTISVYKANS